ncbi:MAG: GNAT family N-acetyltransferase [Pseudomonas marincola]
MNNLVIKSVGLEVFLTAIDWAAAEGWNPGIDDLEAFYSADPSGFMMGFLNDVPVSSISVVKYGENFGFLGFYIVRPDLRGSGVGLATWNAGMAYLEGRVIGLDGVVDQQSNYRKSGFEYVCGNIRYSGIPVSKLGLKNTLEIEDITLRSGVEVIEYDRAFFPAPRDKFIHHWIQKGLQGSRIAKCVKSGDKILGYGVIRKCRSGFKIGPLFCDDEDVADTLFCSLVNAVGPNVEVSLDVPNINEQAVNLAERYGLKPAFETARMYKGGIPDLSQARVFGVTTFELG